MLGTTVYSSSSDHIARTDASFSERRDFLHHNRRFSEAKNILEKINIGMVSQFVIDPMHLIDEGVMKKILTAMVKNKCRGAFVDSNLISDRMMNLVKRNIPSEFTRDCRRLTYISYFKATEFKQILNYTGIVIFKKLVNDELYYHFLLMHCAVRILSCPTMSKNPEFIRKSKIMLQEFVNHFSRMYGVNKLTHNVHNLLHIADCVLQFGALNSFSAYKFECYMQHLKRPLRNASNILQQIYNRQSERETLELNIVVNKFGEFNINPKKTEDSYCFIKPNKSIKVLDVKYENGQKMLLGVECLNLKDFYEQPIRSSDLGIWCYIGLSTVIKKYRFEDCLYKYFQIPAPFENTSVLIPIIHQCYNRFD